MSNPWGYGPYDYLLHSPTPKPTQQDIDTRSKSLELAKALSPKASAGDLIKDAVKIEAYLKTGKAN